MMTAHRLMLALSLALLGACNGGDEREPGQWPLSRAEIEKNDAANPAETAYRVYCIGCHGADGRGNGGTTGADFTAGGSALTQKPDAELIASVRDGRRGTVATMPAHKPVLSDAQIASLVAYVKQRFAKGAPANGEPSAAQGEPHEAAAATP